MDQCRFAFSFSYGYTTKKSSMKILMCRPDYFDIEYEINPWMHMENQVNHEKALEQWNTLYKKYQELGVTIELIDQVKGLPDMVFTANGGIVKGKTFISGNFRFSERKGEEAQFQKWFQDHGYTIVKLQYFQGGEGDALFYKDILYMGWGFRSDPQSHTEVATILKVPYVSLHLIDPFFYDFDTTFFPLGTKGFMYYPMAFDEKSREVLRNTEGALEMTKEQAQGFIGNSVFVNDKLLVGYLDEDLKSKLASVGVEPILLDMSEFKKSGGGIKCCTLYLDQ